MAANSEAQGARATTSSLGAVAAGVAALAALYFYLFGTDDSEEGRIVAWSVGLRHEWFFDDRGPRTTGLGTFLGVPVYDGLQATGNQLPYQASWAQLPFWFLRYVLYWNEFVAFHIFVATFCSIILCFSALRSWQPAISLGPLFGFGMVLLAPLGFNVRQNDWPSWYVSLISVSGLAIVLLSKRVIAVAGPTSDSTTGLGLWLCVGMCSLNLVTSSPGSFPVAAALLGFLLVSKNNLLRLSELRRRLNKNSARIVVTVAALLLASFGTLVVVGVDLVNESGDGRGLNVSRSWQSQGFIADQGFVGVTDPVISWMGFDGQPARDLRRVIERATSLAVSSALLPILRLFRNFLPGGAIWDRLGGSFPRGEFTASSVLFGAAYALVVLKKGSAIRRLIRRILLAQAWLWVVAVVVNLDVLPGFLQPSSAWQLAAPMLSLNIFLTVVLLWHDDTRRHRTIRVLSRTTMVLAAVWTALQLSFLYAIPTPQVHLPDRKDPFNDNQVELKSWLSELRDEPTRFALAVTREQFTDTPRVSRLFLAVSLVEKPMISPSPTKIRNNELLVPGLTLDAGVPPISLELWPDAGEFARLLSFLQVKNLVIPSDDPSLADGSSVINQLVSSGFARETRELRLLDPRFETSPDPAETRGPDYGLRSFELQRFSLFSASRPAVSANEACNLLLGSCDLFERIQPLDVSDGPQVNVCSNDCLWTIDVPASTKTQQPLVLPIKFNDTLVVTDADVELTSIDYDGFLAVDLPPSEIARTLSVRYEPNAVALLRVLSSYVNSVAVVMGVALVLVGVVRRRQRQRSSAT